MSTASAGKHAGGRRPGTNTTRDAILDAALDLFARHGYEGTSMRAVAAAAAVDPALVRHYFKGKDALFAATVLDRTDISARIAAAFDGSLEGLGRRLTTMYFHAWEDPGSALPLTALARSALSSDAAMHAILDLHLPELAMTWPGAPQGHLRGFTLAISHLFGVAAFRYIGKNPQLADIPVETLIDQVAPAVQHYLAETDRPSGVGGHLQADH